MSGERAPAPQKLFDAHHEFHARLVRTTVGPVVRAMIDILRPRLDRYEWFHGPLLRIAGLSFSPTYEEHAAIIDRVRSGGEDALQGAVRDNWENAGQRLAAAIAGARDALDVGGDAD